MTRQEPTSKPSTAGSTLGAWGLLGVGALLVATLFDRSAPTARRRH